ncbi:type I restriction endonuclease subunit S [Bacteroides fragilis]|uniref:Type I restriction endonuclease subunit S n=2 Tax=Bacteroides fragilis TaxID=817 RepID=A0A642KUH1_BACFG|nr:type I restriction endonuclease subunit S [Bacteroides fragilis]KAA5129438.1 type I restriction endonuclease subunit S [Bacteroides fragilis]KAA5165663.1 type I restriction endonuclease subunit S [Bacteroides fragilis]KAA5177985.1 type I restriction endonuclease subunit S [Bacteroides fragilis]KAA5190930.1 type I restriction endonuclease subunit S [Bacteroides fragilis]
MNSYYEKFIATGEVKCIDEEIPFEIPQGWEWCRISDVCMMQAGKNITADKIFSEQSEVYPYRCVGGNGLRGYVAEFNTEGNHAIVGRQGALCGCLNIETGNFYATEHAVVVSSFGNIHYKFMYWFLMALNLNQLATATAQPGLSVAKVMDSYFPLPPLSEQQRITAKIEELIPIVEKFDKVQTSLDAINNSINDLLKKSILQEAIQGKLVPQITREGTAQELLEQIKQEKYRLVKEGKLKKSALTDSVIYKGDDNKYYERVDKSEIDISDEIPFEIPQSWSWCRLSNVITLLSGRDLTPDRYNSKENGIPYITGASNFYNGNLLINRWTESPMTVSHFNDLLITCKGTIGEMAFNRIGSIHIARQIMALTGIVGDLDYIRWFLYANISSIERQANSMIPGISRDTLLKTLLPLPPKLEQKRINDKIVRLLDELK